MAWQPNIFLLFYLAKQAAAALGASAILVLGACGIVATVLTLVLKQDIPTAVTGEAQRGGRPLVYSLTEARYGQGLAAVQAGGA